MLSLGLNSLALCFSVSAFCTSYWCEGTHKVVKPPCLSAVKKGNCVPINSNETMDGNVTMDPHVVQYIWETGEDKYAFRYFHTGFWLSCEEHHGGTKPADISDGADSMRAVISLTARSQNPSPVRQTRERKGKSVGGGDVEGGCQRAAEEQNEMRSPPLVI